MNNQVELHFAQGIIAWEDQRTLVGSLSAALARGRLGLVLGAGASFSYGLPQWGELIDRMFQRSKMQRPDRAKVSDDAAGTIILEALGRNEQEFANLVQVCMYDGFELDLLQQNATLRALGALVNAAVTAPRNAPRPVRIVSFNYDNVLELYLRREYGLDVASHWRASDWDGDEAVQVVHPHGYLPLTGAGSPSIVFARIHHDLLEKTGYRERWDPALMDYLRTRFPVFVGLSGDCPNLRRLLVDGSSNHTMRVRDRCPRWGVRICDRQGAALQGHNWRNHAVQQLVLDDYNDLAQLFSAITKGSQGPGL